MRTTRLCALTVTVVLAAAGWLRAQFPQANPFTLNTYLSASAITPGGTVRLALVWTLTEDAYLYRDKISVKPVRGDDFTTFEVEIPRGTLHTDALTPEPTEVFRESVTVIVTLGVPRTTPPGILTPSLEVGWQGCGSGLCYPPVKRTMPIEIEVVNDPIGIRPLNQEVFTRTPPTDTLTGSVWWAALAAFVGGVLTSLTPCVFPLVPVTLAVVGIEPGRTGRLRGLVRSLIYVSGIVAVYATLGGVAAWAGKMVLIDPREAWVRWTAAGVFVLLAGAMLGLYNLQLPGWFTGRLRTGRVGGAAGVFLVGVASAALATTCVAAPLLAALTFAAGTGKIWGGALVGGTFAAGMGVLLMAVGTFAELVGRWSSGAWTQSVKRAMGFVLLGAAIYFLEPVVPRWAWQVVLGAWFVAGGVFAGGLDRLESGSGTWPRLVKSLGLVMLAIGATLIVVGVATLAGWRGGAASPIDWVRDVEAGLERARTESKPVVIDFDADWCRECDVMDATVFRDADVVKESERFVMIRADVTRRTAESDRLMERFGVKLPPTVVFVATDGGQRTVAGTLKVSEMLDIMRGVE